MNDIDFLPIQYHQKNAYRHAKPWQIIVVSMFLGLVAVVTVSQFIHRQLVERELAGLSSAYEMAVSQKQRLADIREQLKQMEIEAELIAYLHHPWPQSQLLSALVSKLPEEITLQQLQIIREMNSPAAQARTALTSTDNSGGQKSMPPAARDLQSLRNQHSEKQTIIILAGTATDSSAIHRFLEQMQNGSLFTKAELDSVTSQSENPISSIQFRARLFVKPGYGQTINPTDVSNTSYYQQLISSAH
jgi:hypothetical protein